MTALGYITHMNLQCRREKCYAGILWLQTFYVTPSPLTYQAPTLLAMLQRRNSETTFDRTYAIAQSSARPKHHNSQCCHQKSRLHCLLHAAKYNTAATFWMASRWSIKCRSSALDSTKSLSGFRDTLSCCDSCSQWRSRMPA